MDRRLLIPKSTPVQSEKGKEKADQASQNTYPEDEEKTNNHMYSLTIECESSPSTLYTPIRISNDWISDDIEKPADANDATAAFENMLSNTAPSSLNWLEPKPTYLEASAQGDDAMNLDSAAGRLPNIRFVARFNPPLVVPFNVHAQLHQTVGIEPLQDPHFTTFVGLALRPGDADPGMVGTTGEATHEIRSSRTVLVIDTEGKETDKQHDMSLYVPRLECSRTLESLPFSHPKQLVEMLPILRQYAHTTSILKECFYEAPKKPIPTHKLGQQLTPNPSRLYFEQPPLQVDISVSYTAPKPTMSIHVPHPSSITATSTTSVSDLLANLLSSSTSSHAPLSVTLEVLANGDLHVSEQNVLPQTAGKALDIMGDLGVWAEWLRRITARR
jgi:hypothetical protein